MVGGHPFGSTNAEDRSRTIGGPTYMEMIEEMDRELTKVVEDFDHAVSVEALLLKGYDHPRR